MAWVRFKRNYDWKPTSQTTIAYKAGMEVNVKAACAEMAVNAGAAVRLQKGNRDAEPVEETASDERAG
jgi:hypothetical protein